MNLLRLLFNSSQKMLILAAGAGVLSGVSTVSLLSTMNAGVNEEAPRIALILSFIGFCILRLFSNVAAQVIMINLSQASILRLRLLLCRRILESPLSHLEQMGTSRLLATLTDDVQSIGATVLILPNLCISLTIILSCFIYLLWLSPTIFAITFLFLGLGILSYQLPARIAMSFMRQSRESQDRLYQHFRAVTEGIKELKLHQRKRNLFFEQQLRKTAEFAKKSTLKGMTLFATASSWSHMLFFITVGIIIFALPLLGWVERRVLSGYVITITYLIMPLDGVVRSLPAISKATVAVDKVKMLDFRLSGNAEEEPQDFPPEPCCQTLTFKGITHTYQSEDSDLAFTLGPIEVTLGLEEIIFLTGGNGSGKSSFVKLLTGLYLPENGSVYLNEKQISELDWEWYRQHFSVVFADYYLFERFSNFSQAVSDEQIRRYLVDLQLDHKVGVEDGVLSTISLSQGQRKRLALLSAYLEDRPIYVFDEWASDQDPMFKKIFYTKILPDLKRKGKMVIAVTHDDQYFHVADRIIKFNSGKIESDSYQTSKTANFA